MPILIVCFLLAALALPAAAQATTTVSVEDCGPATPGPDCTTLVLEGDGADSYAEIWPQEFNGPATDVEVTNFFFDNAIAPKSGSTCTSGTSGSRVYVRCPELTTDVDARKVRAELGGGADSFMTFVPHGGGISVDGGTGADSLDAYAGTTPASVTYAADLIGGEGPDALAGDGGADTLDGGPGNDTLRGSGGADQLLGGSESDALTGDAGQDTLRGGEGADDLAGGDAGDDLDGEDGNDELAGDGGDDELAGGAGNDRFEEGAGRDDIAGGAGVDHVTYQLESYDTTAITLDDAANDGDAGEQDNVHSDVEDVTTANGGSTTTVTGSAVRNVLTALADRNTVAGGAGDDLIVTTCYPSCIDGGDVVDGGPGADEIRTGDGADRITGGPGPDEIYADNCSSYTCSEPDVIDVVDGERDDVYCGGGGDVVRADPVDQLLMCDTVSIDGDTTKPPPPTITTTTTSAAQPTPQTSAAPKRCRVPKLRKLTLAKAKQRLKAAGCRVGKVRKPRGAAARRLVVRKQSRRAGTTVPRATKVNLTLARRSRA